MSRQWSASAWPAPGIELEARVREPLAEVGAVRPRHEHVELALPEPRLAGRVGEREAPARRERPVVVGPSARSLAHRLDDRLPRARPLLGAAGDLLVGGRQVGGELVEEGVRVALRLIDERLQVGGQRLLGLARRGELVQVELIHPGEEVEVGIVRGADAHDDADPRHACAQPGRAGQRVRAAAGRAHHREPLDPEVVDERGDVGGGVDDPSVRLRIGFAVAGPVVRDHPQAQLGDHGVLVRVPVEARSRSPMVAHDRRSPGVAVVAVGQAAPVRRAQVARARLGHLRWRSRAADVA